MEKKRRRGWIFGMRSLAWRCLLTQIDHLLHMELLGHPLSFLERDYTPAITASPLFTTHSLSALWVIH
jgi:hypothetical protein